MNVVPETTISEDKVCKCPASCWHSPENFIERIDFVDNTRTLDSVIRREMEIIEGDPFNRLKIEKVASQHKRFRLFQRC